MYFIIIWIWDKTINIGVINVQFVLYLSVKPFVMKTGISHLVIDHQSCEATQTRVKGEMLLSKNKYSLI